MKNRYVIVKELEAFRYFNVIKDTVNGEIVAIIPTERLAILITKALNKYEDELHSDSFPKPSRIT